MRKQFLAFLLLCCVLSLSAWAQTGRTLTIQPAASGKRIALVIGNDSYQLVSKLNNARADARAMAKALEQTGFRVTLRLDVGDKALKEAMRTFKSQVGGGDEAVFYFSGHGVQLGAANYLLPVDIGGESEEQIKDDALPLQRVLDDLQDQKARFTLAIVDACRNNPFSSRGRAIGGRGLAPTSAATGQMVIYSAGAGQQALDRLSSSDANPNGLFTRIFLNEMSKPGVPVDRVLRSVRDEVVRLARSVGHEQVPALYDQALGEFYFRPGQPVASTPVSPGGISAPAADPQALEISLWESVRDSRRGEELKLYLDQYPNGRFVALARSRLRQLDETRPAPPLAPSLTALPAPVPASRPTSPPLAGAIVIKFSHVVAADTPKGRAAAYFAQRAGELTGGRVKVEVYANSALYKDREEIEALQLGAVQMLVPVLSKFGPLGVREFEVFDLPYIFDGYDALRKVTQGPVGKQLLSRLEAKGMTGLAFWDNGFKSFSANTPIRVPADLRGRKMRIQSSKVLEEEIRALGGVPLVMAFSEVYQALQTGVADGTENPIANLYIQRMHEVQRHLTLTEHGYHGYAVIANKRFWDGLPADIRAQLESAMADATNFANRAAREENAQALEQVQRSGKTQVQTLSGDERRAFKRALMPVHQAMEARIGSELIRAIYRETDFDPSRL